MDFVKGVYHNPRVVKVVSFILGVIVLYYLLNAGITIAQILAVTAFIMLLLMIGLAEEMDYLLKKYTILIKKGTLWKD
jgi:hypothetical protein|tara:strand:+ start:22036 stop:22269 length:234 start_codon:yes stop_codon:yes gene_type:complete